MDIDSWKMRKSVRGLFAVLFFVIILYLAGYFLIGRSFVPNDFIKARKRSVIIAKDIVDPLEKTRTNLEEISSQDRQGNFHDALNLVREELESSSKSRLKALELSEELEKILQVLISIKPAKARNLVVGAIQNELSLIRHLIIYNDILNNLLKNLELKFSGDNRYVAEDVQNLIKNMNSEAQEINSLNNFFNEKMKQFDKIVGK